jgi:Mg-chelatase subunit ChlD
VTNPLALLLWPLLVALTLWWARRIRARSWSAIGVRLVVITLLVLALANPGGQMAAEGARLVVLVDRSASMNAAGLAAMQNDIAARFALPEMLVVQFAAQPQLVVDPEAGWPEPGDREAGSDIAGALSFAGQLLAGGQGSVLLVSDGAQTTGDALSAARALAEQGVRVDVLPLAAPLTPDVVVESVQVPQALWAGESFEVLVNLYSASPLTAAVQLVRDEEVIGERELFLPPGLTPFTFPARALAPGLSIFRAEVELPEDALPQNNAASAIIRVRPTPNVLIASHHPEAGSALHDMLAQNSITATVIAPERLPTDLTQLLNYQLLVLEDVNAQSLSLEQWLAVRAFTQVQGRGLVVAGGRSAYSLGGYDTIPLEAMLPVELDPPRRAERPPATLLLIIDSSSSMAPGNYFGPPKIDLAKEAAMRAIEILQPNDRVGVIGFANSYYWVVRLGTLGQGLELRQVLDQLSVLAARGITDMFSPLQVGVRELAAQPTERKHIVLLSDGQTYRGTPQEFEAVVAEAAAADITVSTIALGQRGDARQSLMAAIAEWGNGRYHLAADPAAIPRLMLSESQSVNSDPIQRGRTQFQLTPHPLVSGFSAADIPPIEGYLALTLRPEADTALTSGSFGDPVLAAWQYGLGRVVAWTSDLNGDWTRNWRDWEAAPRFWAQIVRYALPDPSQGPLFAASEVTAGNVTFTLLAAGADGKGINLADGYVLFRGNEGSTARVDVPQTAPGEYTVTMAAPEPGAYRAAAVIEKDDERLETPVGFVVPYSPEYRPRTTAGADLLAQIAQTTGGRIVNGVNEVQPPRGATTSVSGHNFWLVLAALVLWVGDIALRRRVMPWPER